MIIPQTITQSPILPPLTPLNMTTRESDAGGQYDYSSVP